jgi:hypothetical protein
MKPSGCPRLNTARHAKILNAVAVLTRNGWPEEAEAVMNVYDELEALREGNRRRHAKHQMRKRELKRKCEKAKDMVGFFAALTEEQKAKALTNTDDI